MITKWRLANFKSVRDPIELDVGRLTVLAGPNSSGKSTLIQSILMVSQTLSSRVGSRPVVLNGHLCKLGQFDDLRSEVSAEQKVTVGWECVPPPIERRAAVSPAAAQTISCAFSFDVQGSARQQDLSQLQPRLYDFRLEVCGTTPGPEEAHPFQYSIKAVRTQQKPGLDSRVEPYGADESPLPLSTNFAVTLDSESLNALRQELPAGEPVGCVFRHFLPIRLVVRFDKAARDTRLITELLYGATSRLARTSYAFGGDGELRIPESVISVLRQRLGDPIESLLSARAGPSMFPEMAGASFHEWLMGLRRIPMSRRTRLQDLLRKAQPSLTNEIRSAICAEYAKDGRSRREVVVQDLARVSRALNSGLGYVDRMFTNSIRYLGPLRDEPKALYPVSASVDPLDVGLRGEFTAAVVEMNKSVRVEYLQPGCFLSDEVAGKSTRASLHSAVNEWLRYLGVAEDIQTSDRGKLGHELKVDRHDLTHVGVGVSQVLPIVVLCLLAQPDATLIFEQPELHLHPAVQTRLADFFLSMALLGKQCIIETHSEYLVNRLRFRIATSSEPDSSSPLMLYFVENREGTSHFNRVNVNQYGAITEWPEGFFDQSQRESEAIVLAALAKRKREDGER